MYQCRRDIILIDLSDTSLEKSDIYFD